jgi:hypothetical protein
MPKKPDDIPTKPGRIYKDSGWVRLGDWLGTGTIAPRLMKYRSFEEARKFARGLSLKNGKEWQLYTKGELKVKGKPKKPNDIPSYPNQTYKKSGWISMPDWLGTKTKPKTKKVSKNN